MIRKRPLRFHLIRPAVWVGATVAFSLAYSPEAAAQGKKGGRSDIGEAAGSQPGAPGIPGGQPGFPGSGGAAPANQGPAPVPKFELTPRTFQGAVITADPKLTTGAPFDTKEYFYMPAEADNAGPLVLDALTDFADVYAIFNASDNAGREQRSANFKAASEWLAANPNPRQWDANAIEQAFGPYRVTFAKLHEAHKKSECVIPTAIGLETSLAHVQSARDLSKFAAPLIFADLARGDKAGAINKFDDALRLGADLQPRAVSITLMVVSAMHKQLADMALPILLNAKGLTTAEYDNILASLKDYRQASLNMVPEVLKSDYLFQTNSLNDLAQPGGAEAALKTIEQLGVLSGTGIAANSGYTNVISKIFTPENVEKFKLALAGILKDQLAAVDAVGSPDEVAALGKKLVDIQKKGVATAVGTILADLGSKSLAGKADPDTLKLMGIMAKVLFSGSEQVEQHIYSIVMLQTQQSLMEALTATRRWYASKKTTTNGKTLDEVAKEAKLEAAPLDSFSGKPLKLIWTGSGPAVYSVGPDRKDDDGKLLFGSVGEDQKPSAKGDIIVTLALGGNPLGAPGAGAGVTEGYSGQAGSQGGYGGQPGSGGPPQAISPGPGGRRGSESRSGSGGPPQAISPGPGGRGGSSGAPGGASQAVSPR